MISRAGLVISCNVGRPRDAKWLGREFRTSFFKEPVSGPVEVLKHNLAGDEQADLKVHGGPDQAVYVYPFEHYGYWRERVPELKLPCGAFGENLTVSGLNEGDVQIGDRLRIGTSLTRVTQPRTPCYKLAHHFGREDMIRMFWDSCRTGFYLSVVAEGLLREGDEVVIEDSPDPETTLSVNEVVRLYRGDEWDQEKLARAQRSTALPEQWKKRLREL